MTRRSWTRSTSDDGPMVELLLSRGADVNIANEGGHTPLLRAVGFDRPLLVARLLAAGADPNVTATVTYLEMMAASGGYLDEDGLPVPPEETPILETLEELRPRSATRRAARCRSPRSPPCTWRWSSAATRSCTRCSTQAPTRPSVPGPPRTCPPTPLSCSVARSSLPGSGPRAAERRLAQMIDGTMASMRRGPGVARAALELVGELLGGRRPGWRGRPGPVASATKSRSGPCRSSMALAFGPPAVGADPARAPC